MKTDWDAPVYRIIVERSYNHLTELKHTSDGSIPGYIYEHDININDVISTELHGFCDSPKDAYAAVVTLRYIG